jgi:hypothetical protein
MEIFFALGVIAFVMGVGFFARKLEIINEENTRGLSSYVYYLALPSLFLSEIARMDLAALDYDIALVSVLPIVIIVGVLALLHLIKLLSKDNFILLSLAIVFGSHAFFGVTFFEAYAGEVGLNFAVFTSSIFGPIGILSTIFLFEYATKKHEAGCFCKKIFTNPLIISILLGVFFAGLQIPLGFIGEGLAMVGKTAGPLAIFALGTFLFDNFSIRKVKAAIPLALFRILVLPLVAFGVIYFFFPEVEFREFLILQAGIPTAISLAIFARRYNYRVAQISDLVILTSLGSFFTLTILDFLLN